MEEVLRELHDAMLKIPLELLATGHLISTGAVAREVVMDNRPTSFMSACVVTYLSGYGGVTLVSGFLGKGLPILQLKWLALIALVVTWLLNYSPLGVRRIVNLYLVRLVATCLFSLNAGQAIANLVNLGFTFPSPFAPILLGSIGTVGAMVVASLVYGNQGSVLNSPTVMAYKSVMYTVMYTLLCSFSPLSHEAAAALMKAVLLVSNVAPMLVPFRSPEAFLAKWLHDLTGTEVPFKILEAVQPRPIAKPKKA